MKKSDTDEMKKLTKYVEYLISEGELYQTEEQIQGEKQRLKEKSGKETQLVQFHVISKGFKWFKVETEEGYENKVKIREAPQLKVGNNDTSKVKVNWYKNPSGYDVTYTNIHDIEAIEGFCINCRNIVEEKYKLCYQCNKLQKKNPEEIEPKYCHKCGKSKTEITLDKPLCKGCFLRKVRN